MPADFKTLEKPVVIILKKIMRNCMKNGDFNPEMKQISQENSSKFTKNYDLLVEYNKKNDNKEEEKLSLLAETFAALKNLYEAPTLWEKLEIITKINQREVTKEFINNATSVVLHKNKKMGKFLTFVCQHDNELMLDWLLTKNDFLLTSNNDYLLDFSRQQQKIITKEFDLAITKQQVKVPIFLINNNYINVEITTKEGLKILRNALTNNNGPVIQAIIKKNFTSWTPVPEEKFLLLMNLMENEVITEQLLSNGVPGHFTKGTTSPSSSLIEATLTKDKKIVALLLKYGADANFICKVLFNGKISLKTPLTMALLTQNFAMAELLIDHDIKTLNCYLDDGIPILLSIIELDAEKLVQKIVNIAPWTINLEKNTVVKNKKETITPLLMAILKKNLNIIKILTTADPDLVRKSIKKRLIDFNNCITYCDYDILEQLLKCGVDVNAFDGKKNYPPIIIAMKTGDFDKMSLLQKYGADLAFISSDYETPWTIMHASINEKNIKAVIFLRLNGITVNTLSATGHNILTLASKNRDNEVVIKTLTTYQNYGIEVNYPDKDGNTALHWAIKTGNVKLVETLIIEHAAKRDIVNNEGVTALDLAQKQTNEKIKQIVLNNDSEKNLPSPLVSVPSLELSLVPAMFEINRINDIPARNYSKKGKSGSAPKTSSLVTNNPKKNSSSKGHQLLETKQVEPTLKYPSSANKTNPVRSTCSKHQPDAEKIVKSLNYMAKKEVQDRLRAEEQKRRKAEQKEKVAVKVLESEEQNISNLEQSENNKEYYQFIAKLREKLTANIDNDFYVVKRANGKDHEGGRPAIKIYESKGSKNKQCLFGFISSIKEGKKPAQSLTFSLENDRDSYLYEINWADKNEIIGKWKTLNVENKVQPKVTTAHKVEIANLVALEHLQTIFATEFIDFNHKQTKTKFEQVNLGATTSGAIAQPVNTEQFSIPNSLSSTYFSAKNDNDFYYKKVKNDKYNLEKPLDVVEVNAYQEQKTNHQTWPQMSWVSI